MSVGSTLPGSTDRLGSVVLLPHFMPHKNGLQTLGGRLIALSDEDRRAAARCSSELSLSEIDRSSRGDGAWRSIERLIASGYIVRMPPPVARTNGPRDVVLSPHIDDAALSVGGSIAMECSVPRGPTPLVVNIFSVQSYQSGLRVPADRLQEVALAEDRIAGQLLGYESCSLGLLGAQDRHGLNFGSVLGWNAAEFGAQGRLRRDLDEVVDRVVDAVRDLTGGSTIRRLLAPAAVGGHLDHVIAALAAPRIAARLDIPAARVIHYEDLPYAAGGLTQGLGLERGPSILHDITAVASEKRAALSVFKTRLRASQVALCMAHADRLANGNGAAERKFLANASSLV